MSVLFITHVLLILFQKLKVPKTLIETVSDEASGLSRYSENALECSDKKDVSD